MKATESISFEQGDEFQTLSILIHIRVSFEEMPFENELAYFSHHCNADPTLQTPTNGPHSHSPVPPGTEMKPTHPCWSSASVLSQYFLDRKRWSRRANSRWRRSFIGRGEEMVAVSCRFKAEFRLQNISIYVLILMNWYFSKNMYWTSWKNHVLFITPVKVSVEMTIN